MNFSSISISVNKRIGAGTQLSHKLRKESKVPAVIYGHGPSLPIFLDKKESDLILKMIASGFNLIKIKLDEDEFFVIVKDIQEHVYKPEVLHFDFQRVKSDDNVCLKVFLKFCSEKNAPGIKQGGFLIKQMSSVSIKCLVSHIPDYINVDLSKLNVNQSIFLSEIVLPENVEIPVLKRKEKIDFLVASIIGARKSEVKNVEAK